MNPNEISRIAKKLKLPLTGRAYLRRAVQVNKPSRRPTGKYLSVHDTIASRKMKWTQNSESRSTELPFLLSCEFDDDVLAYYCQPEPVQIKYIKNDRGISFKVTHDFLVIKNTGILFIECKTESKLSLLLKSRPERYYKKDGRYRDIAAEQSAESFGFKHIITTDRLFTTSFTRNCVFLLNYIDDFHRCSSNQLKQVYHSVHSSGGRLTLKNLIDVHGPLNSISALMNHDVFVDFDESLLCNPEDTWIYSSKSYLDAFKEIQKNVTLMEVENLSDLVDTNYFWWNTEKYEIINKTHNDCCRLSTRTNNGNIINFSESELYSLIGQQVLYVKTPTSIYDENFSHLIAQKKAYQIDEAFTRLGAINNPKSNLNISSSTLSRLRKRVKDSADPFQSILSDKEKRGNRTSRISQAEEELMTEIFETVLLVPSPPPAIHAYRQYAGECRKRGLQVCSSKSFYYRFNKYDKYYKTLKQKGFKAAYSLGPKPQEIDLNWTLPTHGDFILEVAHIDHTPIEMSLASSIDGTTLEGTLNLSIMYDAYSRLILAVYMTFEKPSYRCTMMLLRECYRRHKRLPLFIAVDHGRDFESIYFDRTLAELGIHKRFRPTSASRHGSTIERTFGIAESEFIHRLQGNKQLQKLGRGQSTTHSSKNFASWTPDSFEAAFKDYAYLHYPNTNRRGISSTPQARWALSKNKHGGLPGTKVHSENHFYFTTLPEADKQGTRRLSRNQIEFKGLTYRLSTNVSGYDGEKESVLVKYDPYNMCHIWALVCNRWIKLFTTNHVIKSCFDKNIRLPFMEVQSRQLLNGRKYRQGSHEAIHHQIEAVQTEQGQFNSNLETVSENINPENTVESTSVLQNINFSDIEVFEVNETRRKQ